MGRLGRAECRAADLVSTIHLSASRRGVCCQEKTKGTVVQDDNNSLRRLATLKAAEANEAARQASMRADKEAEAAEAQRVQSEQVTTARTWVDTFRSEQSPVASPPPPGVFGQGVMRHVDLMNRLRVGNEGYNQQQVSQDSTTVVDSQYSVQVLDSQVLPDAQSSSPIRVYDSQDQMPEVELEVVPETQFSQPVIHSATSTPRKRRRGRQGSATPSKRRRQAKPLAKMSGNAQAGRNIN